MPIPGCSRLPPGRPRRHPERRHRGGRSDVRAVGRLGGRRELAAMARPQPRQSVSTDTGLLQEWDADGPALAWQSAGPRRRVLEPGRRRRPHLHDGRHRRRSVRVLALSAADGKLIWKTKVGPGLGRRYPGPRGTPTVDGELVYAVGTEGDVVVPRDGDGKERWRAQPDPRLRRADDVRLEVQRVAARRRRSGRSSRPGRAARRSSRSTSAPARRCGGPRFPISARTDATAPATRRS